MTRHEAVAQGVAVFEVGTMSGGEAWSGFIDPRVRTASAMLASAAEVEKAQRGRQRISMPA